MQGLTYLKRMDRRPTSRTWYPYIILLLALYTLAIWAWAYGSGLSEGYMRADAGMRRALKGGYDIGVEKGLDALEEKRRSTTTR